MEGVGDGGRNQGGGRWNELAEAQVDIGGQTEGD